MSNKHMLEMLELLLPQPEPIEASDGTLWKSAASRSVGGDEVAE
jgi:hypothetical protein